MSPTKNWLDTPRQGKLTIVRKLPPSVSNGRAMWEAVCDCGRPSFAIRGTTLARGAFACRSCAASERNVVRSMRTKMKQKYKFRMLIEIGYSFDLICRWANIHPSILQKIIED